jgi:phospholipid N-methyltransferase
MTATTETHPLISRLNTRIARLTNEAATKELTPRGNMTAKRQREYDQRLRDARAIRNQIRLLEGFRDALATSTLPGDLLGIGALSQETFDYFCAHKSWPTEGYNQSIRNALAKNGITENTYADKRERFLALAAPPDVAGDTALEIRRREAAILPGSIQGFFPTPPLVVARMLEYAQIMDDDTILEPSAGTGVILDTIRSKWADAVDLWACECNHDLRDLLALKGYRFVERIGSDFMDGGPFDQDPRFDLIVGNPPFERGQDREHIRRAYDWLAPEGRLVMICSEGPFFRNHTADVQFRLWLANVGAETEQLPEDAFKPSGTGTRCRIVFVAK